MTEEAVLAELRALGKSMDAGFERVHGDINELKGDVKGLNSEGLPRRVSALEADVKALNAEGVPRRMKKLEDWRRSVGSRWWALAVSLTVVTLGAWASVLFERGI